MTEIKWNEIKKLLLDVEEQEFTLTSMREEELVYCFCSDNQMLIKLKEAMKQNPEEYKCYIKSRYADGSISGYEFRFPKKYLKFLIRERNYTMSEEQREASKERMRKAREVKSLKNESLH